MADAFTPIWQADLDAQRARAAADPELLARFDAAVVAHLAAGPKFNFAWSADTVGYTFQPQAVFENVQRTLRIERAQAEQAPKDALISVALRQGSAVVITNLDALAREFELSRSERADIRATLAEGHGYSAVDSGGWSQLPKGAVVTGVLAKKAAA